ncbi:hypothetical protein EDB81DRAFT_768492 [Dactylonectria macrodidyma]|uniref:Uncharacterized protein n=1 Tax=Dactylonectria macrodidyma TaxID=307937 RepID=A0A9P9I971_9HYPO|nr:hypothetical protein EDB81DRAFT_768492 [Dactylonectria macrodidyma]
MAVAKLTAFGFLLAALPVTMLAVTRVLRLVYVALIVLGLLLGKFSDLLIWKSIFKEDRDFIIDSLLTKYSGPARQPLTRTGRWNSLTARVDSLLRKQATFDVTSLCVTSRKPLGCLDNEYNS